MKTLHILGEITKARGGPVAALRGILEATSAPPFQNSVLCADMPGEELSMPDGVAIHRFPLSFPARFLRSAAALRWLNGHRHEFDLVVIHEIWPLLVLQAGVLLARSNIPMVVIPHNSLDPFDLEKKKQIKRILGHCFVRRMLQGTSVVLAATGREAARFQLFGASPPTGVLPLSVPDNVSGGDRMAFRRRFGIGERERVALFFGRLDPKKGVDLLLRAAADMEGSAPAFRLVIVGGGREACEREIRALAASLFSKDSVVFTGFLSGPGRADAFAAADVFVLPSRYENFGIAVIEAMHAGVPALVSNQVFLTDEAVRADAVQLCEPGVGSVVRELRALLESSDRCGVLRGNGARFARGFLPETLAPQTRDCFLKYARPNRSPL